MLKTLEKPTYQVGTQVLYAVGLGSLVAAAFKSPEVELTENSTPGSEPCTPWDPCLRVASSGLTQF